MKAQEVHEHFRSRAAWVDPKKTVDQFLHGDGSAEVAGVAVGWMMTLPMAEQAAAAGLNLFISHEPIVCEHYRSLGRRHPRTNRAIAAKRRRLTKLGLTVLRCHDAWDRFPRIGIPDAWAKFLGLLGYRRQAGSFYGRGRVAPTTARALARRIARKTSRLGQAHVEVFNPSARVARVAVGTGAITALHDMLEAVRADCYVITNDGTNAWTAELHSADCRIPLIRVDHATAELPGIMALADYLAKQFPSVPVRYIPYPRPYDVLT